ncbi:MAG: hypothetical protein NW207_03095 [Cytophagales bacterium]|nr:hypothetical protein [Cytophagales bacterium]
MNVPVKYVDNFFRFVMLLCFIYFALEVRSIKKTAQANRAEMNFVNSKIDYVDADINNIVQR